MQYEIKGSPMPAVICRLDQGEQMITEGGGMSWMSAGMTMQTTTNGGIGKALGRMLTKEKMFQNIYTSTGNGNYIAFASSFMGDIIALNVQPGIEYICQKSAFLASTPGVKMETFFKKSLKTGIFGGEGFIMQKFSGQGTLFIEIDGSAVKYNLAPGEQIILDTGHLVMMSATCKLDTQTVKGAKNVLFGGEGLFNTVVTGPGEVVVQTMPIPKLASTLIPYLPTGSSN
ncbi:MAG: TIGR00266 family protein [Clostridia bacterium]|nr:TIGR00266 family protein [Clostridia bacterium]